MGWPVIGLTSVNDTLEVITGAALNTDYLITYVDTTSTTHTPGSSQGTINSATTTTVLTAPAASTYRGVKLMTIVNRGTTAQTITVQKDVSATNYIIFYATLLASESLVYSADKGFTIHDRAGREKPSPTGFLYTSGQQVQISRLMTAPDAANYHYCWSKDNGFNQGAWSPGTPGLNGRATDGTTSNDYGCLPLANAPSGYQKYLKRWDGTATIANTYMLYDVLWVNSGIVVTTTTNQAITSGAMPARDVNGSTNGEGLMIGLLVTTATTNAAVINGATVSYTNSQGTAGRTATLTATAGFQIPATAVIGTMVWFMLQAGDTGVRSIEGITLGTSLVAGAVSLVVARPLASWGPATSNDNLMVEFGEPGVRIYDGSCILGGYVASTTTAPSINATIQFVDK